MQILTEFRDKRLLTNRFGRWLVHTYYGLSPPVTDYLRQHPGARTAMRYALLPLMGLAYLALKIHPLVMLFGLIFLLLGTVFWLGRPCRAREKAEVRRQRSDVRPFDPASAQASAGRQAQGKPEAGNNEKSSQRAKTFIESQAFP